MGTGGLRSERTAREPGAPPRSAPLPDPVVAESPKPRQGLAILDSARGLLAGDDVVNVADGEPLDLDMPAPRLLERLDAVGSEDEVQVEGAVLQLNEVLAALDLRRLLVRQLEADFSERENQGPAVRLALLDEQVRVLRRVGETQQDGTGLAQEQVVDVVAGGGNGGFFRLGGRKTGGRKPPPAGGSPLPPPPE